MRGPLRDNGSMPRFPDHRPRRLRATAALRAMVRETSLSPRNLIYPLFVTHASGEPREIGSMPGNYHWPLESVAREVASVAELGIPAVLLFGIPEEKDAVGSGAYAEDGVVQRAVRAIKREVPQMVVVTDVCLCEYT